MLLQPVATPVVSRRSTTAQMALPEPPDMLVNQISICAGNIRVKQDPRYLTMLPYQAQKLPLEYCSSWPIWVTNPGGKVPLSRVPVPEAALDEWWTTWVPPAAFEQLWLPEDLPQPTARPAIGLVWPPAALGDGTSSRLSTSKVAAAQGQGRLVRVLMQLC